jgi:hypothetical protein
LDSRPARNAAKTPQRRHPAVRQPVGRLLAPSGYVGAYIYAKGVQRLFLSLAAVYRNPFLRARLVDSRIGLRFLLARWLKNR